MSAQHTPGPWSVEQGQRFHWNRTVITAVHAGMTSESPLASLSNVLGADECAPDAHLIAAAPDLLDALQTFANIGEYRELREAMANCLRPHEREGFLASFGKAREAIAKATGSAS